MLRGCRVQAGMAHSNCGFKRVDGR